MALHNGNQNVAFQVQAGNHVAAVLVAVCAQRDLSAKHRDSAKRPDDSRFPERSWRLTMRQTLTCPEDRPVIYASGCPSIRSSMRSMPHSTGRELPPAAWAALVLSRA
jgi:hypothetical protein